jgi:hypothetical protein
MVRLCEYKELRELMGELLHQDEVAIADDHSDEVNISTFEITNGLSLIKLDPTEMVKYSNLSNH